jgi:hypothetical protein
MEGKWPQMCTLIITSSLPSTSNCHSVDHFLVCSDPGCIFRSECNLFWLFCTTGLLWPRQICFSSSGILSVLTQLLMQQKYPGSVSILYYMFNKLHLRSNYSRFIFSLHWPVLWNANMLQIFILVSCFLSLSSLMIQYKKWLCILSQYYTHNYKIA